MTPTVALAHALARVWALHARDDVAPPSGIAEYNYAEARALVAALDRMGYTVAMKEHVRLPHMAS